MLLEGLCHESNLFVTLTYKPEELPSDGSLDRSHYVKFLKRLRARVSPVRFRYFIVGEYGDESWRPHFHACLFGFPIGLSDCIEKAWGKGFVHIGDFNRYTAQYCAGYVVKKMTAADDERLRGRAPEFARMSLNPGLGAAAMEVLSAMFDSDVGLDELEATGDVPRAVRVGGALAPLGRYLRERLRKEIGMPEFWRKEVRDQFMVEKGIEMLAVFEAGRKNPEFVSAVAEMVKSNQGAFWSLEAKSKIKKGRSL